MRVLILNQAFHPDVVSTAQHASDLAVALAETGDDVTVIASRRGYDDPERRFARKEVWRGVRILRVGGTRFGKAARWRRAADFATFIAACAWRILWLPRQDVVVALTSPPLISLITAILVPIKARELVFWSMDLNPDEAIAAGWLRRDSLVARTLSWMLRYSLRRSRAIIALDRFMAERISAKSIAPAKITVLPPWSHDDDVKFSAAGRAQFRKQHGLEDKFVVMYSGNHSPCHPLCTLLEAATQLSDAEDICFCFIGGGSEMQTVKRTAATRGLTNVKCLPYQPREQLAASLSSADLHVVLMGDAFIGIVHPCKIYNILITGSPVLYIGPAISHITELLKRFERVRGHICRHGDVAAVVRAILQERAIELPARSVLPDVRSFSKQRLVSMLVRVVRGMRTDVFEISNNNPDTALVSEQGEHRLAAAAEK